jgi:hypothetical protein
VTLVACGDESSSDKDTGGSSARAGAQIDDPCSSPDECLADNAECVDIGDGALRCQARCLGDGDCGAGAHCLFRSSAGAASFEVGMCFRLCESTDDCAEANWRCEAHASDSEQRFCLAPCALRECSSSGFRYSCGTGSFRSSFTASAGVRREIVS